MNIISIIILILSSSSLTSATYHDLCVADTSTEGPGGFSCKKSESVSVKDFVFSGLVPPANDAHIGNYSLAAATVSQIPGLNGYGISMARLDLEVNGVFPMHTHPGVAELVLIDSGSVNVGFISITNVLFSTNLKVGDVFTFPPGLFHFLMNSGESRAVVYISYSSDRPSLQYLDSALFGNELSTDILAKATYLDDAEIKRLKGMFGGTN